jgi:prepilin-type processing-associated H-X9-DG protein
VGNCECRFQLTKSPKYAETYHDGGTNCGYLDGSVRWIHTELDRTIDSYYLYRMDGARRRFASPDKVYNWEAAGTWTETPR